MPDVKAEVSAPETVRCPVCGEAIARKAKKCIHCSSELTWRKYLTFSNTTLALITALVAVISAATPVVHTLVTPKNSDMRAVFSGIDTKGESISLLISNEGRRTGALNRVGLAVQYGPDRSVEIYPNTKDNAAVFVGPEKTVGVTLFFADAQIHWSPQGSSKDLALLGKEVDVPVLVMSKSTVYVRFLNSDGKISNSKLELSEHSLVFPVFRRLLRNTRSDGSN